MKKIISEEKKKIVMKENGGISSECNERIIPRNSNDLRSFTIPMSIGNVCVHNALLGLGANINLIPFSLLKNIGKVTMKPTRMTLRMANGSVQQLYGIVEDML